MEQAHFVPGSRIGRGIGFFKAMVLVGLVACPNQVLGGIHSVVVESVNLCSVSITVTGWLSNSCWGADQASIVVDAGESDPTVIHIQVEAVDSWEPGYACLAVIIPYEFVWHLPSLSGGQYHVETAENRTSLRNPGTSSASSDFEVSDNCCCAGRVGDANGSGSDEPTVGDVSAMIDAKFISGTCDGILACLAEADINQSGGAAPSCDDIAIGDISVLIDYLFITGTPLGLPDCL